MHTGTVAIKWLPTRDHLGVLKQADLRSLAENAALKAQAASTLKELVAVGMRCSHGWANKKNGGRHPRKL
jgi:hypothetical protein